MSAELRRNSLERNQATRPARPLGEEAPFLAEDPEMLRWRADVLMDEMMVGAIDLSANGPTLADTSSSVPARAPAYEPPAPEDYTTIASPAPGRNANGVYRRPAQSASGNGHHPPSHSSWQPDATRPTRTSNWTTDEDHGAPADSNLEAPEPEQAVLSAEERYRRLAGEQSSRAAVARPHATGSTGVSASPWAEEQTWQPNGERVDRLSHPAGKFEPEQSVNGAVRRVSAQAASVMAATIANSRRSNLLPRMSTADVEAMQREIFTLQSEIDNILPAGHESNQRARRLLEKAGTILQQDALRSAEVEYYLQQVRTIFQRVQQTIYWSSTYRNRLLVYLAAWLGLALLVIIACYMFALPLEDFVRKVGRLTVDHPVARHFLVVTTALFAGALGGASGALFNLWQQGRQHYGFIDRKYGLRGLILPLMGALVGLLLCLLLLVPLSVLKLDLARQPVLAALPALLAFLFGLTQESIYGTRG